MPSYVMEPGAGRQRQTLYGCKRQQAQRGRKGCQGLSRAAEGQVHCDTHSDLLARL